MLSWDFICQIRYWFEWLQLGIFSWLNPLKLTDKLDDFKIPSFISNEVPLTFDHVSSLVEICFDALGVQFLNVITSWFVKRRSLSGSAKFNMRRHHALISVKLSPHIAAVGNPSCDTLSTRREEWNNYLCTLWSQNIPHVFIFLKVCKFKLISTDITADWKCL